MASCTELSNQCGDTQQTPVLSAVTGLMFAFVLMIFCVIEWPQVAILVEELSRSVGLVLSQSVLNKVRSC